MGEIQLKTNVEDWFAIPSEENIADCLTKGLFPSKLNSGSMWQDGPNWLGQPQSDWPIQQDENDDYTNEIEQEMSRYYKKTTLLSLLKEISKEKGENNPLDRLMHNFSTLQHLAKVTAWILHWTKDCTKLKTEGGSLAKISECKRITASEYQVAL